MSKDKKEFTPSQKKAILHTGSDILISAGAGSGKTATLTERIIKKLLCGADITRMLVVTFTKEAANELKSRITSRIAKELKSDPDNLHLRAQIVKISSADISTIHSFCLKVIRPNFDKLSIDSDIRVGEENEIEALKRETMSEVIDFFYEDDTPSEDFLLVCDAYSQLSREDALDEKLLTLYNQLSSTSLFLDTLLISKKLESDFMQSPFGKVLLDEISLFVKHFKPIYIKLIDDIMELDGTPKYLSAFTSDFDLICRLENALNEPKYSVFKSIFESYTPLGVYGIKDSNIDSDFAKMIREKFKKAIAEKFKGAYFVASEESISVSFEQNAKICSAMHRVLSRFDEEFAIKKRKLGICDFNDIERLAYKLLVSENDEPSDIARKIALDYDEIYIDEYQDTNSVQDKIFSSISRNNRFMVGDIKQSIYRFRSAEPEIFSSYRTSFKDITSSEDEGDEGKTIFMSDNFRCDKSVIDFTNCVSDYMFFSSSGIPYEKQDNLGYKKLNPENYVGDVCEIRVIDRALIDEDSDLGNEVIQAKYVAKRIKKMLSGERLPSGEFIKPSDIAILLRKGRHKGYYIDALNELGIASEYIDDVKFFEKPHILLLLSLLNVIDNPYNDAYLAAALHSEVFGFTLDELIKIRKHSSEVPLFTAVSEYLGDEATMKKISSFLSKLDKMREGVSKMNAYEAVSYVMCESGLISQSNGAQRKDLINFYNQAREYEKNSFKGLYKFLLYIEGIKGADSRQTVFTNPDNCVRIMSVHASKGLEFGICFLCNTETGFATQDTKEPILFERHLGIAGYVGNTGSLVKYNTLLRKCASIAIDKATKNEEMRVLYVSMTRARTKLIVTASLSDATRQLETVKSLAPYSSEYYVYSQRSHIEYILNALYLPRDFVSFDIVDPNTLLDMGEAIKNEDEVISSEETARLREILRQRFDFKYQYDYLNKLPSKLSVSKLYPNILDQTENDEVDIQKPLESTPRFLMEKGKIATASQKGTATHVFMQFCDFESLYKNGYEHELKRLTDLSFISQSDAELINRAHIEKFIKSELLSELLRSKKLYRELRFNVMLPATEFSSDERIKRQSVLVQGVIDCVFENERGEIVLVDYKTDAVTEDNYIEVLTERHKNQLEYYKKAVFLMFERPVAKTFIYSVPLAKVVEV